uniref:Uncharacterized protein n=1 Tax=Cannabis sativa TaxID=3483 RepID=A0A803NKJ3_CANSA
MFKPFRFCNHWLYYHGFKEAVWRSWTNSPNQAGLVGIMQKLVQVKQTLRRFSRETVGDVITDFKQAKEIYIKAQEMLAMNPTNKLLQQQEKQSRELSNFVAMLY